MVKLAYIVEKDWDEGISGVNTFIRTVHDAWEREFDCDFISYPQDSDSDESYKATESQRHKETASGDESTSSNSRDASSLWILLGYVQMLWRDARYACGIRSRCKGRVVVVNEFGCETLPVALRIAMPGKRIVAIAHTRPGQTKDARHWVRLLVERLCYLSVSDIVFNSESNRSEWVKKLGRGNLKGSVIHLGLPEPDLEVPDDYPEKSLGSIDFVCVSRFAEGKGHANLLAAWARAVREIRDARHETWNGMRLILVGDGDTHEESAELAKTLGIGDSVVFLGARQSGSRYFNSADVAVQLATEPEAFGLTVLEAMSRGKPVVATRIGGIVELLSGDTESLLVNPNDLDDIASKFRRCCLEGGVRKSMGQSGRKMYEDLFRESRMLLAYKSYLANNQKI